MNGARDGLRKTLSTGFVVLIIAALAAGCGSSSTSSSKGSSSSGSSGSSTQSTGASSGSGAVAAAAAAVAKDESVPQRINVTTPLKSTPKKGLTVAFAEANDSAVQEVQPGMEAAVAALGWHLKIISYDVASPTGLSGAIQQAVAQKVDFIVEVGSNSDQFTQGLKAAQSAHIPIVEISAIPETTPDVVACAACHFNGFAAGVVAQWILADSKGKAHVLVVNTPSFPIAVDETTAVKQVMSSCSACSVTVLNEPLTVLGTSKAAQAAAADVRAHPDINYIFTAYGELDTGLTSQLKLAGISNVKLTTQAPLASDVTALRSGQISAAYAGAVPVEWGWRAIDEMARYSEGMSEAPAETPQMSGILWTPSNAPANNQPFSGVPDNNAQYEALWHVG